MIAFLCTTLSNGRKALLDHPLTANLHVAHDSTVWTEKCKSGALVGFLASKRVHLVGEQLCGFMILDAVDVELVRLIAGRLRTTANGSLWNGSNRKLMPGASV